MIINSYSRVNKLIFRAEVSVYATWNPLLRVDIWSRQLAVRQQLFDPIGALRLVGEMKLDVITNVTVLRIM